MLLTLRFCGLRANELVTLRTSEVDLDARRISLVGKGRKARVVPIPHDLAVVLRDYLDYVRPKLPASPYLFANPRGNRKLRGRYGPRALYGLVQEAGTSVGVTGRHFPHRWRHTYATSLSAGAWTFTLFSACSATPTSRQPRDTCISRTPTFSPPSTGRSRKAEFRACAIERGPEEALACVAELRGAGARLREIATVLADEGHRTKRRARWHPQTVARALQNA